MAGRPLRPATDRRLGRPLPHQLPNRTQAAPKAPFGFEPQLPCGISPSFPGLFPTSGHVPTRSSPVRHCRCRPCDLHVLSMPPAFALSQDQTLRFIRSQHSSLSHHTKTLEDPSLTQTKHQHSVRPPFPPTMRPAPAEHRSAKSGSTRPNYFPHRYTA